jgi:hypothetical protein
VQPTPEAQVGDLGTNYCNWFVLGQLFYSLEVLVESKAKLEIELGAPDYYSRQQ